MTAEIFNFLEEKVRREESEFIECGLCWKPIKGLTKVNIGEYTFYVEGGGALHAHCYNEIYTPENIKKAEKWMEDFLKDK